MAASLIIQSAALDRYVAAFTELASNPYPLLQRWGIYLRSQAKQLFQKGASLWPPKSPIFAYWEGNKPKPLIYTGKLLQSIVYDIVGGNSLRIGSNLPYAATHQFGGPRRRHFFPIIPERDAEGKLVYFEGTKIPKGRLTTPGVSKPGAIRLFLDREKQEDGLLTYKSRIQRRGRDVIFVPLNIEPRARPFLKNPDERQLAQMVKLLEQLLRELTRGGADVAFA